MSLTFDQLRIVNVERCVRWHSAGITSWSPSDWMTAIVGELGELASLIKMRNRERDGLTGNKFSPTDEQIAKEAADVMIYLDLFCAAHGIDLGIAIVQKFNEVSERNGFPDRLEKTAPSMRDALQLVNDWANRGGGVNSTEPFPYNAVGAALGGSQ